MARDVGKLRLIRRSIEEGRIIFELPVDPETFIVIFMTNSSPSKPIVVVYKLLKGEWKYKISRMAEAEGAIAFCYEFIKPKATKFMEESYGNQGTEESKAEY